MNDDSKPPEAQPTTETGAPSSGASETPGAGGADGTSSVAPGVVEAKPAADAGESANRERTFHAATGRGMRDSFIAEGKSMEHAVARAAEWLFANAPHLFTRDEAVAAVTPPPPDP